MREVEEGIQARKEDGSLDEAAEDEEDSNRKEREATVGDGGKSCTKLQEKPQNLPDRKRSLPCSRSYEKQEGRKGSRKVSLP